MSVGSARRGGEDRRDDGGEDEAGEAVAAHRTNARGHSR